jgi:hypothetical protein
MDMPLSAQALYFHLGMRADDDGFVSNARRVQKLVGAADDDLKILLMKRFVLAFDSGVIVIKHWRLNNYVKGDRYTPTLYQEEKGSLFVKSNGVYTDHPLPPPPPTAAGKLPPSSPADAEIVPEPGWNQNGTKMEPQVRVGQESKGKGSLGEERIDNFLSDGGGDARTRTAEEEVSAFVLDRGKDPSIYFGMTPDVRANVELLTQAIFKRFANRKPTDDDYANSFLALYHNEQDPATGTWTMTISQDRKNLLMYAFEQAATAGNPADWRYINGILARLGQRGITTLEQADDYDYERDARNGR